jgi:HAD superfamily hydrolase (TIGR01509 family)
MQALIKGDVMTQYRAVMLDLDGTLLDSNDAHARAWVDALAEHGHAIPYDQVHERMGMGGDQLLLSLTGLDKESPEGTAIAERRKAILMERYFPQIQPTPGVRALLERLRDMGLHLIIATSSQADEFAALVERAGVRDLILEETTASDAEHSKPSPDIVLSALSKLNDPPATVVMLGDTPYDIEAARKAGVDTIALRSGGFTDDQLAGAIAIYDDPADLLAHLDASPLGRPA